MLDLYGANEIPSGQYFVLGDKRLDSRHPYIIGLVNEEQILGEVELIIYPFSNVKWIK